MLIVKFRGLIDKIIQVLSTIIMGVMVIAVCWQVITRYILNNPSTVTEEALRYLLIWVTMVAPCQHRCGSAERCAAAAHAPDLRQRPCGCHPVHLLRAHLHR